jgi:hypothetical protein
LLTTTAVLAATLGLMHLADDVVRGFEPGGTSNYTGMMIVVVWLVAALILKGRLGLLLLLVGSLGGAFVPLIHMRGSGLVGPRVVSSGAVFFWVFTLMALGVTSWLTAILCARALWTSFTSRTPAA